KGALLAKGRLLGIQFLELFKDNLYFELGENANIQAMKIKKVMTENGIQFLSDTSTNQIFPILENTIIQKLSENFEFYVWQKIDEEKSAIRIITSWNTKNYVVEEFTKRLKDFFLK
ncbi:MAG: threonine aldolase, partial [Chryseobacterium sp.]